jgi:phosphatidylglycerophosphatase A
LAPGTAGSALGLVLVAALGRLPMGRIGLSALILAGAAALFFLGVWAAGEAEKFFQRKDPGQVVIDEVVGQMLTFLARPDASWKWLLAGFFLFRVFDVVKPFPARQIEKTAGGWGIMLDDVIAGLYSLGLLSLAGLLVK